MVCSNAPPSFSSQARCSEKVRDAPGGGVLLQNVRGCGRRQGRGGGTRVCINTGKAVDQDREEGTLGKMILF